jgi:hypothetical protein
MAGPLERHGVGVGRVDEPIDGEVPSQRVCPLVTEDLDGLRLLHLAVEKHHEPFFSPKALAQDRLGEPGSPNDDRAGWRALPPKARQNP